MAGTPIPILRQRSVLNSRVSTYSHFVSSSERSGLITFINELLGEREELRDILPIADAELALQKAVENGVLLCMFIYIWIPGSFDQTQIHFQPKNKFDMLDNHTLMLRALKHLHCKIGKNLNVSDMISLQPHLLLALLSQIYEVGIRRKLFQALVKVSLGEECAGMSLIQAIKHSFNGIGRCYGTKRKLKNFATDLKDCEIYLQITDYFFPGQGFIDLIKEDEATRASSFLHHLKKFGFIVFLSADNITTGHMKMNSMFASYLFVVGSALSRATELTPLSRTLNSIKRLPSTQTVSLPNLDGENLSDETTMEFSESKQESEENGRVEGKAKYLAEWERRLEEKEVELERKRKKLSLTYDDNSDQEVRKSDLSQSQPNVIINIPRTRTSSYGSSMDNDFDSIPELDIKFVDEIVATNVRASTEGKRNRTKKKIVSAHPHVDSPMPISKSKSKTRFEEPKQDVRAGPARSMSHTGIPLEKVRKSSEPQDMKKERTSSKTRKKRRTKSKDYRAHQTLKHSRASPITIEEHIADVKQKKSKDMTLADVVPLLQYLSKQNAELKKHVENIRSELDSATSSPSTSWNDTRNTIQSSIQREGITIEEALFQCWKMMDECERMQRRLEESNQKVEEETVRAEEMSRDASIYKFSTQRLQTELTMLKFAQGNEKPKLNTSGRKKSRTITSKTLSLKKGTH